MPSVIVGTPGLNGIAPCVSWSTIIASILPPLSYFLVTIEVNPSWVTVEPTLNPDVGNVPVNSINWLCFNFKYFVTVG